MAVLLWGVCCAVHLWHMFWSHGLCCAESLWIAIDVGCDLGHSEHRVGWHQAPGLKNRRTMFVVQCDLSAQSVVRNLVVWLVPAALAVACTSLCAVFVSQRLCPSWYSGLRGLGRSYRGGMCIDCG